MPVGAGLPFVGEVSEDVVFRRAASIAARVTAGGPASMAFWRYWSG
ncbi:hypothetical protein [Nocardia aurea]|uniref:Uncharacterized protein n=1 Tax=Nocardia aurea TaxID=2144174 RepID=A0ABV3G3V7_9NOCA